MFKAPDPPLTTTSSVSGSEFSAASYKTNHTDVSDARLNKHGSMEFSPVNQANYYNWYAQQQQARWYKPESSEEEESEEESEEEDSDSDGSEESSDSADSDDESDVYRQWQDYYANMYRSGMYGYMPYMNAVQMNPMQMNPMQMNPMQMNPMQMNPMRMNPMSQMNPVQMNTMGQNPQMQMFYQMMMNAMCNPMNTPTDSNGVNNNGNNPNMNAMMMNMMNMMGNMNMNTNNTTNTNNDPNTTTEPVLTPPELPASPTSPENISPINLDNSERQAALERTLSKLSQSSHQLIKNSRMSTIKSNRYASVPSQELQKEFSHRRNVSLGCNFKPNENEVDDSETEGVEEMDVQGLEPTEQSPQRQDSGASAKSFDSIASGSSANFRIGHKSNKSIQSEVGKEIQAPEMILQPVQKMSTPQKNTPEDMDTQVIPQNTDSFKARTPSPLAPPVPPKTPEKTKNPKKSKSRKSKKHKIPLPESPFSNPQHQSIMGPIDPNMMPMNAINMNNMNMSGMNNMNNMNMNNMNMNMNMPGSMADNRHLMMANPMLMSPPLNPQSAHMPQQMGTSRLAPPRMQRSLVNDPEIQHKIQSFTNLRAVIASGNKSYEYRLKWVKMLINATNYRLYVYINIKGEPIASSDATANKELFIKSASQHIVKLIRDVDSANQKLTDDIRSDICLVYANILSHHYHTLYEQSFGMQKDIDGAIAWYERAIIFNPSNFKAHYVLGDLYEYEVNNGFDQALIYYRQSAKLGYNRAIYKMALMYLNIPSIRSHKFIKILRDLCNIEVEKTELDDDDKQELTEIIASASYELGKVYEGVYPGDLTVEDDFIQKCLEIVPVNYGKALSYYNKSAKLNYPVGLVKLGRVYEFGELNRTKNPHKSIQWYLKAVSSPLPFRRNPDAMIGLSRWYLSGSNGESKHIPQPNPERALKWCERAIKESNSPDAYYQMAQLADAGLSNQPATYWCQKAAAVSDPVQA